MGEEEQFTDKAIAALIICKWSTMTHTVIGLSKCEEDAIFFLLNKKGWVRAIYRQGN